MFSRRCILAVLLCSVAAAAVPARAGNAYRYYMLYRNSEIYRENHPDQEKEKEPSEHRGPQYDGWGNLVDPPPPPPPGGWETGDRENSGRRAGSQEPQQEDFSTPGQ